MRYDMIAGSVLSWFPILPSYGWIVFSFYLIWFHMFCSEYIYCAKGHSFRFSILLSSVPCLDNRCNIVSDTYQRRWYWYKINISSSRTILSWSFDHKLSKSSFDEFSVNIFVSIYVLAMRISIGFCWI